MIAAWLVVVAFALGADEASTVQRLHELEWERSQVVFVTPLIAGGDAATRAEGARTLGRLRDEGTLTQLEALQDDPEDGVQRAVAEALAFTPGSADAVRTWLATVDVPRGPAASAREANGVMVRLIEALGHQGSARDLETLGAFLDEPWPVGAAAARAMGRLGVRGEAGASAAVMPLADRLDATDPRTVDAAAWALSRIGMAEAPPEAVTAALSRLRRGASPQARAWLVRAVWPQLSAAQQDDVLLAASVDPSRLPRVAVLDAQKAGDVPADVISTWLADPDPWVRIAAIRALGRDRSPHAAEALDRHGREADAWEAAEAVAALGQSDPDRLADPETPPQVRAVLAALTADPAALQAFALDEDEAIAVRTAAAAALLDDEATPGETGIALLAAADVGVREAGIELTDRLDVRARVAPLLGQLRVETDEPMIHLLLGKLLALHRDDARAVPRDDPYLTVGLRRGASARAPSTRGLAAELAGALEVELPKVPDPDKIGHELHLPDGSVVQIDGGWPTVAEARRIRGARVFTSVGIVQLELDPDTAPMAVANFAALAETGFYDGQVVHRMEPAFVVQSGCPRGDGWGGPGWTVPDELSLQSFERGAVGMARAAEFDTGGSQWFVTTGAHPHLDGRYTRFGRVAQGLHIVERMQEGAVIERIVIERIAP